MNAELSDEAERDFCTREWSRVEKDKTVSVIAWLMELRAAAKAEGARVAREELEAKHLALQSAVKSVLWFAPRELIQANPPFAKAMAELRGAAK